MKVRLTDPLISQYPPRSVGVYVFEAMLREPRVAFV